MKKLIVLLIALICLGIASAAGVIITATANLPQIITVKDYQPLLVSEIFDRKGNKAGEFARERREIVPYEKIPDYVVKAFLAAEDSEFFEHSGINFFAILRASIANLRAGRTVQGGSTITQQVAKTFFLSREKTYTRKIKEAILSYKLEENLSKQEILYLYLNQIYFGHGAHGVQLASKTYFKKPIEQITLAEAAVLAGLPQAPSRYSPVINPKAAKERQLYVLRRMADEKFITKDEAKKAAEEPLQVYFRENYQEKAPYYVEAVRQILEKKLGVDVVHDKGLKIHLGLDLAAQDEAQKQVQLGLRELDKRQGYRGPSENIQDPKLIAEFLLKTRNELIDDKYPFRMINPDGTTQDRGPLNLARSQEAKTEPPAVKNKKDKSKQAPKLEVTGNLADYLEVGKVVKAVVYKLDDNLGLTYVRFAESKGIIDLETMRWARKPDPEVVWESALIKKPSEALKVGDIIEVKVVSDKFQSERLTKMKAGMKPKKGTNPFENWPNFNDFAGVELEQEPEVQGALISIDQATQELIALVGGYDLQGTGFNRAYQAARQTGSSFKSLVYAAALDKGYTASSILVDAPLVYEEGQPPDESGESVAPKNKKAAKDGEEEDEYKIWKPDNHDKKFEGELTFRNALVRSLNVPAVKLIEKVSVPWVTDYARRLGIFSSLNPDFTLALGSSSVTLFEMTKVFSEFGRLGKRTRPILIKKVTDTTGKVLAENISLDERFEAEMKPFEEQFEQRRQAHLKDQAAQDGTNPPSESKEPPIFFDDSNQLIRPQTAYLITHLLQGTIEDPGGTGVRARALGRPAAGKTGTTNNYYDAWFVGYTPQVATGVWCGFDKERTLGRGEVGGRSALPIWLGYMTAVHKDLPTLSFPVPDQIVFANIDAETGKLASPSAQRVIRQAYLEGTEPSTTTDESKAQDGRSYLKEELTQ